MYENLLEDKEGELEKIHNYFLGLSRPGIFHPSDKNNLIKMQDSSFEDICTLMEERYNVQNPGRLSLFRFVSKIEYIEEKINEKKLKA